MSPDTHPHPYTSAIPTSSATTSMRSLAKPLGKKVQGLQPLDRRTSGGTPPDMGVAETKEAIDKAYVAQAEWAAMTARARSDVLWRLAPADRRPYRRPRRDPDRRNGQAAGGAKSEVSHAAAYLQWYAEEANRIYGVTISAPLDRPPHARHQAAHRRRRQRSQAWNFPASMVARKITARARPPAAPSCSTRRTDPAGGRRHVRARRKGGLPGAAC